MAQLNTVGLVLLLTFIDWIQCQPTQCPIASPYPFLSYNDEILPNNSYVAIDSGAVTIGCHTDLRTCCNRHTGSGRGDWYYPNGTRLPFYSEGQISQKRMSSQQVNLYHPGSERSLGVYCCEIETNAVNGCDRESVCVGLYKGMIIIVFVSMCL